MHHVMDGVDSEEQIVLSPMSSTFMQRLKQVEHAARKQNLSLGEIAILDKQLARIKDQLEMLSVLKSGQSVLQNGSAVHLDQSSDANGVSSSRSNQPVNRYTHCTLVISDVNVALFLALHSLPDNLT